MRIIAAAFLASLMALPAWTQAAEDPPGRVARLSHIEGEVSMAPAGTQEWGEAVLNRPLTSADRLFVDRDARAELQVGTATIHLDASTEFSFVDLDDDAMTMSLTEGRATIRIVAKRERETIEINTPNASVALLRPGEYHIEVDDDGQATVVKARSGEAEVAGEGATFLVRSNEMGVFRGTEKLQGDIARLGPRTAFEDWANERAARTERSASAKYVSEGVIGYEDLDEHGHWVHEPEYGYVWTPRYVVAGWAPYRFGRWVWVSPWGWTWIDDARWGFAPFHYGRWAYVRHRWCWVPGPRHVHAVYAPALVAWVGGPHASISISLGHGVGWFPLGPREIYVPGYWHSHRYIHRVNVSNTVIVNNVYIDDAYRGRYRNLRYRYRERPDAVTVVEREHFVRGRPIGERVVRVDEGQLRRWGHDARPPALTPVRESILAGQPRPAPHAARSEDRARNVVARREQPRRVSFDQERRAIEANGGRPVARTALLDRNPKERADVRIARGANIDARQRREADRAAGREAQRARIERPYSQPRTEARIERSHSQPRTEVRTERSHSQPRAEARIERSYSPQAQPRVERAPQPRSEPRSHGSSRQGSSQGRVSSHSRGEHGGGRGR